MIDGRDGKLMLGSERLGKSIEKLRSNPGISMVGNEIEGRDGRDMLGRFKLGRSNDRFSPGISKVGSEMLGSDGSVIDGSDRLGISKLHKLKPTFLCQCQHQPGKL